MTKIAESEVIHRFPVNTLGRDFVVGDIHGEFDKVDALLLKAKFDEETDRLFATGDLIDRGSQNLEALEWLKKPWFFSVLGNHEEMLLQACACEDPKARENYARMHAGNGGQWFYSPAISNEQRIEMFQAFSALPIMLEISTRTGSFGLIHGDVPAVEWRDAIRVIQDPHSKGIDTALWGRTRLSRKNTADVLGIDRVYVGHSPVPMARMLGNVFYIDTGACFPDGHMTLIDTATGQLWTE